MFVYDKDKHDLWKTKIDSEDEDDEEEDKNKKINISKLHSDGENNV